MFPPEIYQICIVLHRTDSVKLKVSIYRFLARSSCFVVNNVRVICASQLLTLTVALVKILHAASAEVQEKELN